MNLIAADRLAAMLSEPDLVVCDVRFYLDDHDRGRREYDRSHIPGARFVDLHHDLAGGPGGGRHPLPPVAEFTTLLGNLGIGPGRSVVAYDSAGGAIAARLWWMMRSIGHEAVSVLDGGWDAWTKGGHPVDDATPPTARTVYPGPADWRGIVDAEGVRAAIEVGVTVIDARAPARFCGDEEPIDPVAGHIPGAINLFHGDNRNPDGTHRSRAELAERFSGVGPSPIVYCGSGVTACSDILAMAEAGITDARLYPGSWSEWCSDPQRPVATGE